MRRLKTTQVKPATVALLKQQGYKCPLCGGALKANSKKKPALDHDHTTGYIRDVLCINCNGMEGKVHNLARRAAGADKAEWLQRLIDYWKRHETPQHGGIFHPTHKTEEEKRLLRNKKARLRRKKAKET